MAKSIQKSLGKARPAYWLSGQTANITAAGHPLSTKSCLMGEGGNYTTIQESVQ